jgi:hypothetical protein
VILVMLPTKWVRLFLITILLGGVFTSAWLQSGSLHWQEERVRTADVKPKKKIIILLVDSLLAHTLEHLAAANEAPALAFLLQNGLYRSDVVSSFPTMRGNSEWSIMETDCELPGSRG